jgi:hypothetical protein
MRKFLPLVVSGIAAISFSALAADYGDKTQDNQGRSVDTGGARPDSSKADGASPVTSPSATSRGDATATDSSSTGADKPMDKETGKERRAERKAKKDAEGASAGASTDTSTSTSTPGNVGSPNSGGSTK